MSCAFEELTETQISELQNKLIELLPKSSALYNVVQLYLDGTGTLGKIVPTTIFAYNGILGGKNAYIIARQWKKYSNTFTWIGCNPDITDVSENMISALELIVDWTKGNAFFFTSTQICPFVGNMFRNRRTEILHELAANVYFMSIESAIAFSNNGQTLAEHFSLRKLKLDDAERIVEQWIYAEQGSLEQIRDIISQFQLETVGLVMENELICWALGWTDGAIHALHTMDEYRGRGYGEIVLKTLAQNLARQGFYPTTQVEDDNQISTKLMAKSGFTFSHRMEYVEFKPSAKCGR